MDGAFRHGIPYISRDEASRAVAIAAKRGYRRDGPARESISVKESEHESLEFLKSVRRYIDEWLALDEDKVRRSLVFFFFFFFFFFFYCCFVSKY